MLTSTVHKLSNKAKKPATFDVKKDMAQGSTLVNGGNGSMRRTMMSICAGLVHQREGQNCIHLQDVMAVKRCTRQAAWKGFKALERDGFAFDLGRGWWGFFPPPALVVRQEVEKADFKDPEWRGMRAQIAGHRRAARAALEDRDRIRLTLEREREMATRGDRSREVDLLRAELAHAVECFDPNCQRCFGHSERLGRTERQDGNTLILEAKKEKEELGQLRKLKEVAVAVVNAHRTSGPGAMQQRTDAVRALYGVLSERI